MTTEPAAFYKNSIEPFATEWVSCSPVVKNGGFGKMIQTTTVMTPFYFNNVYSFLLIVKGNRYWYQFQPIEFLSDKIIVKRPNVKNPLPPNQSYLYLAETMKLLTLYREPLNEFTILQLDERLENMTRVRVFKDFSPTFFYQNLSSRVKGNPSCSITKPGSIENDSQSKRCLIQPVYGPSHNPLEIRLGGEVIRVLFLDDPTLQKNEPNQIIININNYHGKSDAIPLLILDLVSMIATLEVEMISPDELMKMIRERPVLTKKALFELSKSRYNSLENDVYWVSKLFQLTQKKSSLPFETNAKEAVLMIEDLRNSYAVVENDEERTEHIVDTVKNMIQDYHDLFSLQ